MGKRIQLEGREEERKGGTKDWMYHVERTREREGEIEMECVQRGRGGREDWRGG